MYDFVDLQTITINNNNSSQQQQGQQSSDFMSKVPPSVYIKFLLFYFEIFKRLISRNLSLNLKILEEVLKYFNQNYIDSSSLPNDYSINGSMMLLNEYGEQLRRLDQASLKILTESVDEFYSVLAGIIKFFVNQMTEMINKIKYENISIYEFHKLVDIFEKIRKYFDNTIKINNALNTWYKTDKQRIRTEINKLTSNIIDKISITPILNLRTQCEKSKLLSS